MPPRRRSNGGRRRKKSSQEEPPAAPAKTRFYDREAISEHLYCSICQDVFENPHTCPCGHVFCENCILGWLKNQRNCPECRNHVTPNSLHKDLLANKFLGDIEVYCGYTGCAWVGLMSARESHMNECDANPDRLPPWMREEEDDEEKATQGKSGEELMQALLEVGNSSDIKSSLRMRLFRDKRKREVMQSAAEHGMFGSRSDETDCVVLD